MEFTRRVASTGVSGRGQWSSLGRPGLGRGSGHWAPSPARETGWSPLFTDHGLRAGPLPLALDSLTSVSADVSAHPTHCWGRKRCLPVRELQEDVKLCPVGRWGEGTKHCAG